jgi:arylsulfatase A-like enzyme
MRNRTPSRILALLAAALFGSAFGKEKPNVVILYADDWRFDTLGCAGHPIVKTPNLDALAKEGVRFTHNNVTTSICGISRATLFTGQWMSRHGNRGFNAFDTAWSQTYVGILRDNGYWVGHVGKWHNGKFPSEKFDFGTAYSGTHWVKTKGGEPIHVTKKNESDAMEFLTQRPQDKPFALTLAFFATHAEDHNPKQFLPQPESHALYNDIEIPIPQTATDADWKKLPAFFNEKNEGRNRWTWRFDTPEKYQEMMKNYYRLATEVDAACGKVIAELKRQGIYENTLVIFTTDNGYYHGEHGLADKWYPHQESIRVPLIIRDPRMPAAKRGSTNDEFTLNADLAPTILGFAGLPAPATMQGRDIAPLYLTDGVSDWRTEFFYEHPTLKDKDFIPASEALVRKDWKFFFWPEQGIEQLFHIAEDPFEENDLAADPSQKDRLAEMRTRFNELKAQAK